MHMIDTALTGRVTPVDHNSMTTVMDDMPIKERQPPLSSLLHDPAVSLRCGAHLLPSSSPPPTVQSCRNARTKEASDHAKPEIVEHIRELEGLFTAWETNVPLQSAQWYLDRELAVALEEARAIRLTFEAKGQGHKDNDYMVEDRENACVVCASQAGLTLHHVVPYMYRQWFPLVLKSKSSRDLLLLCRDCHDGYERHATGFKKSLVNEHQVPLDGKGWIVIPEHRTVRKAASALMCAADKMPLERRELMERTVYEFWMLHSSWENLSWKQVLQQCLELKDIFRGPQFIEHGQAVVQDLMATQYVEDGNKMRWPNLEDFIKQWRQHFLHHAQPRFLSSKWSVDGEIYNNEP